MAAAAALRGLALFGLWLVIDGGAAPADLAMGLLAAALATWASLSLLPPMAAPRPLALAQLLLLRLPWQAARAGLDVALRALAPGRPRLHPGVIAYAPALPPGLGRDGFLALSALLPGTVPAGPADAAGRVPVHALDTTQPVGESLAREEAAFAAALRHG